MEDIFQILIWLFIIFNVIASVKKSNRKRRAAEVDVDEKIEAAVNKTVAKNKPDYIEFFGMKIPLEKEEDEIEDPESLSDDGEETWNPEAEFQDVTPAPNQSENLAEEKTEIEKENIDKMRELMARAEESEDVLKDDILNETLPLETEEKNKRESAFKQLLQTKSELRRAIVLSEILNKPKALRKNG